MLLKKLPVVGKYFKSSSSKSSKIKVKLAAIAKDEAAYLPEWIHHHLYFGFDEIEIYVNNTTDNSFQILDEIQKKESTVKVINADPLFEKKEGGVFQHIAYSEILKNSTKEGFTYLLFLDIDEFWVPLDFSTSIEDCLLGLNSPDIVSFEWALKHNENNLFGRPFDISNTLLKHQLVKTIFSTSLTVSTVFPHNISCDNGEYILADGSPFYDDREHKCSVSGDQKFGDIKDYYILHRIYRSPIEYVSILGRGMREIESEHRSNAEFELKTNRGGYPGSDKECISVDISAELIEKYNESYSLFLVKCNLAEKIEIAQQFVTQRYEDVVRAIPDLSSEHKDTLDRILLNVNESAVKEAFDSFLVSNNFKK